MFRRPTFAAAFATSFPSNIFCLRQWRTTSGNTASTLERPSRSSGELRQAKRPRSPSTHTRSAARFAPAVKTAADLASDRKAFDIVVLDLGSTPEAAAVTDYFLICTGRSDIHVHAICDRVVEGMKHRGRTLLSSEGVERGQWALLDYG